MRRTLPEPVASTGQVSMEATGRTCKRGSASVRRDARSGLGVGYRDRDGLGRRMTAGGAVADSCALCCTPEVWGKGINSAGAWLPPANPNPNRSFGEKLRRTK
jgi:hypothetical protein